MRELNQQCGDVLLVSVLLTGHVTPIMYVANRLMDHGISVTVIIPEDYQDLVKKKAGANLEAEGGLLRIQLVQPLTTVNGYVNSLTGLSTNVEKACNPFFQKLLAEKNSAAASANRPKCIIADQFLGWTQSWADKLGIPRYVSFPSPAAYAMVMLCHGSLEDQLEQIAEAAENANTEFSLPSSPMKLHASDLPVSFRKFPSFRANVVDKSGDSFHESAGILFNTFEELESETLRSFQAEVEAKRSSKKVPKLLPIGPLLPPEFFAEDTIGGGGEAVKSSVCLRWLDTQADNSVLYIAFGSIAILSPDQIQELAHGLEASGAPFLWILRLNPSSGDISNVLSPGFQERTKDQGFVHTKFAPQLQILSHPATGGFLTHCGWNSCLESILRGVPMVGWPMGAEQGICCRVLVDSSKVAIELARASDATVHRDAVEKAVRALMNEPKGDELRARAAHLQKAGRAAVAPGGSSYRNFEEFVDTIANL